MADNADWFSDVQAALDDAAEEPVDTDSPAPDSTPSAEEPVTAQETPEETAITAEAEESAEAEPEAQPDAQVVTGDYERTDPAPVNWDTDANPYRAKAQQFEQVQQVLTLAQQRRAEELRQQKLRTLADDDPARIAEIQQFLGEVQQPLTQQLQGLEGELEVASKLATVVHEAVRLVAPPEVQERVAAEVERLMALPGGYATLQHHLTTRKTIASDYEAKIADLERKNAELSKQVAARQELARREQTGADVVDSGTGIAGTFQTRWDAASNFDEAFDAIMSDIRLQPTG